MIDPVTHHRHHREQVLKLVVNLHHLKAARPLDTEHYDVYIGRSRAGETPNRWGNPYVLEQGGDRELCLMRYLGHVQRTRLWEHVHELKGKRLACWCAPKACHGHALALLADMTTIHREFNPTAGGEIERHHTLSARDELQRMILNAVHARLKGRDLEVAISGSRTLIDQSQITARSGEPMLEAYDQDAVEVDAALRHAPWSYKRLHHGGCQGADLLGQGWAAAQRVPHIEHAADWEKLGKSAGPARNASMLKEVEAFVVLWDKKSAGTKDFFMRAWESKEWLCWATPVNSDRVKVRLYGVRFSALEVR